jgi:hypothetical protein
MNFYQTKRRHVAVGSNLHHEHCQNEFQKVAPSSFGGGGGTPENLPKTVTMKCSEYKGKCEGKDVLN